MKSWEARALERALVMGELYDRQWKSVGNIWHGHARGTLAAVEDRSSINLCMVFPDSVMAAMIGRTLREVLDHPICSWSDFGDAVVLDVERTEGTGPQQTFIYLNKNLRRTSC